MKSDMIVHHDCRREIAALKAENERLEGIVREEIIALHKDRVLMLAALHMAEACIVAIRKDCKTITGWAPVEPPAVDCLRRTIASFDPGPKVV